MLAKIAYYLIILMQEGGPVRKESVVSLENYTETIVGGLRI